LTDICNIVDEYNNTSEIAINLDMVASVFKTIEYNCSSWEGLKQVYDKLAKGILRSMVVMLLAKAARTKQELVVTKRLCDKHNPGPANLIERRLQKEFNV